MTEKDGKVEPGEVVYAEDVRDYGLSISVLENAEDGERVVQVKRHVADPMKKEKVGKPIIVDEGEEVEVVLGLSLGVALNSQGGISPTLDDVEITKNENPDEPLYI